MASSVSFDVVSKRFGDVHAVRELTVDVEAGEFLVLVGPSGCGKTTALRMVAGLESPTDGTIRIGERDVTRDEPRERDIAMVFQSYALYPHMSVYDNLAFGLKQRRTPKAEIKERVDEAASILGIGPLLQRRPRELSGGQRQRVALGRAIVRRPSVFLMDEPLSNLDAQLRLRTRAELSSLHRQLATTILYVTHDQVEAMTMGTRIAVMDGGVLQQIDTPQRIYDRPANTFVASFIGSPAMNLVEGELCATGETLSFVGGGSTFALPPSLVQAAIAGSRVTLGVRPEHFERRPTSGSVNGISGTVLVVEPHGSDSYVTVDTGSAEVTARLDPDAGVVPGDRINLSPDLDKAHLFAAQDGARLG